MSAKAEENSTELTEPKTAATPVDCFARPALRDWSKSYTPQMHKDRRFVPRYALSAMAEVSNSLGAETSVEITEISATGCRFLSKGRLPIGAEVTIRIRTPDDVFEASAVVVRSTRTGTGVMFNKVSAVSLRVLEKWLGAVSITRE